MAPNADPWRTLGLAPGASQDDIRRAYRRLAKINHPDAAGDAALPRFLAIQAAYDQLAGAGRIRRVGARPGTRPSEPRPGADPRDSWRADPNRARASGRADGRRTPGARPGGGPAGAGAHDRPGAQGGGGGPAAGTDRSTRGSTGGPSGGVPPPGGGAGRSRRPFGRRRPPNTATPGSTSYEGADEEPFEPGWSGATWYGASSGTYWTINPKEYADPRKHGPEYQARARRARDGRIIDDSPEDPRDPAARASPDPLGSVQEDAAAEPPERPAAADRTRRRRPDGHRGWTGETATGWTAATAAGPIPPTGRSSADPSIDRFGAPSAPGSTGATAATGATGAAGPPADASSGPSQGERVAPGRGGPPPSGGFRAWIDQPVEDDGFRGPLLRRPTTPMGRLAMAVLGWPPLGVFVAAAIDQSTGCGTFAASCPEISSPGTWIVQAAILLLLLALPAVAAWSAHGAIAALVVGVPAAVVLSAAGGSNVRETSGPVLLGVLAVAYLGGVTYAVLVGRRRRPSPA